MVVFFPWLFFLILEEHIIENCNSELLIECRERLTIFIPDGVSNFELRFSGLGICLTENQSENISYEICVFVKGQRLPGVIPS